MSEFYTIQEFAKKMKVHPDTIRRSIRHGYINAFRSSYGKRSPMRIPATELERLMVMKFERIKKEEKWQHLKF